MSKKYLNSFALLAMLVLTVVVTIAVLRFIYPRKYSEYVSEYAKEFSLSENLVYAIIKCESSFKPGAVSSAGAVGLMQVMPDTMQWAAMRWQAADESINALYDARTNIKYGCMIYSLMITEFGDDSVALAAYNTGRSNVLKWLKDSEHSHDGILLENIPYPETSNYVKKVLRVKTIYELIY